MRRHSDDGRTGGLLNGRHINNQDRRQPVQENQGENVYVL